MLSLAEIRGLKKGVILNTSYGYDMTINQYCKVVKNTGKSLVCQKIGKKVVSSNQGMTERAFPDASKSFCKPFRIRVSVINKGINNPNGESAFLIGSYPFATRSKDSDCDSKIRGSWDVWNGSPDYENTYD